MNVLDLFSGIGGFSLGLERAGMQTVAFCEIDPFCRAVLRKHWPDTPCFGDIRELTGRELPAGIDVICGGFPCQDISVAGKGVGIDGERSGLWREFARLIGYVRPKYAIVENTAALTFRGLLRVLGDLTEIGYDTEWHCIPACAVGAPHERDRIWIIAYPNSVGGRLQPVAWSEREEASDTSHDGTTRRLAATDAKSHGCRQRSARRSDSSAPRQSQQASTDAAKVLGPAFFWEQSDRALQRYWPQSWPEYIETLRGMDDGVSGRVDGLAALGNTLIPQIPEIIGRAIMTHNPRLP